MKTRCGLSRGSRAPFYSQGIRSDQRSLKPLRTRQALSTDALREPAKETTGPNDAYTALRCFVPFRLRQHQRAVMGLTIPRGW